METIGVIITVVLVLLIVAFLILLVWVPQKKDSLKTFPRRKDLEDPEADVEVREKFLNENFYAASWSKRMRIFNKAGSVLYEGEENRRVLIGLHLDGRMTFTEVGHSGAPNTGYIGFDTGSNFEVEVQIYDEGDDRVYPYSSVPTFDTPYRVPWATMPYNDVGNRLVYRIRSLPFPSVPGAKERRFHVTRNGSVYQTVVRGAPGFNEPETFVFGVGGLHLTILRNGYLVVENARSGSVNTVDLITNQSGSPFAVQMDYGPVIVYPATTTGTGIVGSFDNLIVATNSVPINSGGQMMYNGSLGHEDTPMNKLMWIESHNAHTYLPDGTREDKFYMYSACGIDAANELNVANQSMPLTAQLEAGVRALKFPVAECSDMATASHGGCIVDGTSIPMKNIFDELNRFIESRMKVNDYTVFVVTLDMQTGSWEHYRDIVNPALMASGVYNTALVQGGTEPQIAGMAVAPSPWGGGGRWPSLKEMQMTGKHYIFFLDSPAIVGEPTLSSWDFVFKTDYAFKTVSEVMTENFDKYKQGGSAWPTQPWNPTTMWVFLSQAINPPGYVAGCAGVARQLNETAALSSRVNGFLNTTGVAPTVIGLDFLEVPGVQSLAFTKKWNEEVG